MRNKNIIIISIIAALFLFIIYSKSLGDNSQNHIGIDKNPDYNIAMSDAKAKGEPVFLEFFGNT